MRGSDRADTCMHRIDTAAVSDPFVVRPRSLFRENRAHFVLTVIGTVVAAESVDGRPPPRPARPPPPRRRQSPRRLRRAAPRRRPQLRRVVHFSRTRRSAPAKIPSGRRPTRHDGPRRHHLRGRMSARAFGSATVVRRRRARSPRHGDVRSPAWTVAAAPAMAVEHPAGMRAFFPSWARWSLSSSAS